MHAFIENACFWILKNFQIFYWFWSALVQEHILHYFNNLKLWALPYDFIYRPCLQNQYVVGYVLSTSWIWCIKCVVVLQRLAVLLKFSVFFYFVVFLLSSIIENMLQSPSAIWGVDSSSLVYSIASSYNPLSPHVLRERTGYLIYFKQIPLRRANLCKATEKDHVSNNGSREQKENRLAISLFPTF